MLKDLFLKGRQRSLMLVVFLVSALVAYGVPAKPELSNMLTTTDDTAPELTVTDINVITAGVTWTACDDVTGYTLQLASDDQFTTSGSGETLTETFANPTFSTSGSSYADQNISGGDLGKWTATQCRGDQGAPVIRYGGTLTSPSFNGGVWKVEFDYEWPFGESGNCDIELYVNGTSQGTATVYGGTAGTATYTLATPVDGSFTIELLNKASSNKRMQVTAVRIYTVASGSGSLIAEETITDGTSHTFTGLTPKTTYFARVKGNADWSNVVEFTTTDGDFAPVWSELPAQTVNVDELYDIQLTDYVSGSPTPAITLNTTTAALYDYEFEDGLLFFLPSASGEYTFTFTASNGIGESVATLTVTAVAVAPVLTASRGTAVAAVVGENVGFTVTATGSPTPTVTMDATEYNAAFENGEFSFVPTAVGTYEFTFTASNVAGSDTQTITVTVSPAPVTISELTVDDVTGTTAHANWTECEDVTTYTLQLASDDQFTTGGSGDEVTIFSNDATTPSTAPDDWTYNLHSTSGSYLQLMSGNYVVTEAFDASAYTDLTLSLEMRTYGGNTYPSVTVEYSTDGGTTWSQPLGTLSAANNSMAERTLDVSNVVGAASVRLRIASTSTSSTVGVGIKNIVLTGTEASGSGSLISSTTVNGTNYTFTGLEPETTYFARVKGNAGWSNVEQFTTESETETAPAWTSNFPTTATVNVGELYELADITSYVTGYPTPVISFTGDGNAEINNGNFQFIPEASGDYTFTFTAANGIGSDATATLTVTAVAVAPVLTASRGTSIAAVVGENVEFTVTATGSPAPTVMMAATEYDATFENGEFSFTPDAVGTYNFTFTAENTEGIYILTVIITVSPVPVTIPELTVTDITDATALATWTECDNVTTYTLQLSTNKFAASGTILSEDFSGVSGTNSRIDNFDDVMQTDDWSGENVFADNNAVRIGTSSDEGYLQTKLLTNIGSTVRVVWSSRRWPNDGGTAQVGISEDNGSTFTDQIVTLTDDWQTYTNTFEVSASSVIICWSTVGSSKKRFYLDDITITTFDKEFTVPGTSYEFTGLAPETTYFARVKGEAGWSDTKEFTTLPVTAIVLANDDSEATESEKNSAIIAANDGKEVQVTLAGRTLYKDGDWNTLCLPFSLSAAQIAANANFAGATLMTMDVTEKNGFDVEDGTLYLWFKTATEIEAGVPYLVKWTSGDDITNPVFEGVTISNSTAQTVESKTAGLETVQMVGTYSPVGVTADDKSILFLGDANTLYYSTVDRQIRSCRAYFSVPYIKGNAGAMVRAFVLNLEDDEATGILEVSADSNQKKDDVWYSLDGVRLSGKPTQRGMYINKGKKIVVK